MVHIEEMVGCEAWVVFLGPEDQELLRISLDGFNSEEVRPTIELLAYEKSMDPESIIWKLTTAQLPTKSNNPL